MLPRTNKSENAHGEDINPETEDSATTIRGRKRFTQVAYKIMQNLAQKRNVSFRHGRVKFPYRRSYLATKGIQPKPRAPQQKKPQRKPSWENVVKLASLDKRLDDIENPDQDRDAELQDEDDDDAADPEEADATALPRSQHFASGLSFEAQFAMLKGYEDLLIDSIAAKAPIGGTHFLRQVQSPTRPVEAIHLKEKAIARRTKTPVVRVTSASSYHSDSDTQDDAEEDTGVYDTDRTLIKASDKQLRLNYRLQTAMDMLDNIKLHQGQHVTTPLDRLDRVKQLDKSSVYSQYNTWNKNLSRDFKYKYCPPSRYK